MSKRIASFSPVIKRDSKILILGSVPGMKSLVLQEYYAHPQNVFWKIIFKILNKDDTKDYSKKIKILKENNIAVWDVIESCVRKGSADAEIKEENLNKIDVLLQNYPEIKVVFCNGQKAFKTLTKNNKFSLSVPVILLPSTSPLHTIPFEEKFRIWNENISPFL